MTGGPIGDAAAKFSEATYPLAAKIDWGNTQQITKHLGVTEVVFVTFLLTVSFFSKELRKNLHLVGHLMVKWSLFFLEVACLV